MANRMISELVRKYWNEFGVFIITRQATALPHSNGFPLTPPTRILRKVFALRKRDKADLEEEEAVLEMYKEALGM